MTGDSVTLASAELEHVTFNHPAMGGRLLWGNDPVIVGFPDPLMVIANVDHANKTGSIMVADDPVTGFKGLLPQASLVSFMVGDGALVLYKDLRLRSNSAFRLANSASNPDFDGE